MPKLSDARRTAHAAKRLYDWYASPTTDDSRLREIMTVEDAAATFNVAGFINFPLLLRRLRGAADFDSGRNALLGRWRPVFEGRRRASVTESHQFLREWVESIDHELLFTQTISAGRTHAQRAVPASDFRTSYHAHRSAWTLHFTVRGEVEYRAGLSVRAGAGDLVLISPDASVHYERHPGQEEWLHYWALFSPQPGWSELMQWPMRTYGVYQLHLDEDRDKSSIETPFEQMIALYGEPRPLCDRLLENLLEQVLIRAAAFLNAASVRATDPRVLKASQYIADNLSELGPVAEVAEHCSLSESRLAHLFQEYLGMGVQKHRDCLRIQRAKRLLATTPQPIARVADQVGYSDPAQFSRFFSRYMGCSPRQFRETFSEFEGGGAAGLPAEIDDAERLRSVGAG